MGANLHNRSLRWRLGFLLLWLGFAALAVPKVALAEPPKRMVPLATWPAAKVRGLAPLLRSSDVAVFETKVDGHLRQLSLFTLVAAPAKLVRDVILHAEQYKDFVPNFKLANVSAKKDSSFEFEYTLDYGMFTIDGFNRYLQLPNDPEADAAPVEIRDLDPNYNHSVRRYRFEFYEIGGCTVLAMYGYTDVSASGGFLGRILQRVPTMEQGMALVAHDTMMLSMKRRAEKITPITPMLPAAGNAPYDFLLQRGMVVLLRSQNGRLAEVSMISRTPATVQQLVEVLQRPHDFSSYIPSITKSYDSGRSDEMQRIDLEQSLPILSFRTMYGVRSVGTSIDMFGLSGDLKGGRLRWDIGTHREGAQIVLRTSQQYDRASLIIRQLYKMEPFLEYGINVGLQMVLLVGAQNKAEQLAKLPRSETPIPADNKIYQ